MVPGRREASNRYDPGYIVVPLLLALLPVVVTALRALFYRRRSVATPLVLLNIT